MDLSKRYITKPKKVDGYEIKKEYCECGCKNSYYFYTKLKGMNRKEINQIISDLVVLNSIQRTVKLITGKQQVVNIEQRFKSVELIEIAKNLTFGKCEVNKMWIKIELDSCFVIILSKDFKIIKNGTRRVQYIKK